MKATSNILFDPLYWAAQRPEIAALNRIADPDHRLAEASRLALMGSVIDFQTMALGWSPYYVMLLREAAGYTWYPSALQPPIQIVPNSFYPGSGTRYDPNNPPTGSIKVSLDTNDYPPFLSEVIKPAPSFNPVGPDTGLVDSQGRKIFAWLGGSEPDGWRYSDARGAFIKFVINLPDTPFGHQFKASFIKVE